MVPSVVRRATGARRWALGRCRPRIPCDGRPEGDALTAGGAPAREGGGIRSCLGVLAVVPGQAPGPVRRIKSRPSRRVRPADPRCLERSVDCCSIAGGPSDMRCCARGERSRVQPKADEHGRRTRCVATAMVATSLPARTSGRGGRGEDARDVDPDARPHRRWRWSGSAGRCPWRRPAWPG